MEKHLHIVSFAIPYPPDYGGSIDVFFRIKSFYKLGVKVHLHCFDYLGEKNKELEDLCYSVNYYKRNSGIWKQFCLLPYIVSSRINKQLIENLKSFEAPILFDGLHSTYGIDFDVFKNRKKVVRAHNIEHLYYRILGDSEKKWWKKLYFYIESYRLKKYEQVLKYADHIATVSLMDQNYFQSLYGKSVFIPSSHQFFNIECEKGSGNYVIFHGNLSVSENINIAEWIVTHIAPLISYPVYIAGKEPPLSLEKLCEKQANIKLIKNPDNDTMGRLIKEAHVHLLPLFESCGLKLKLLYALYSGRHCLVNNAMVEGTTLAPLCHIANTPDEIAETIEKLFQIPYSLKIAQERENLLKQNYNNLENAKKIIQLLFNESIE